MSAGSGPASAPVLVTRLDNIGDVLLAGPAIRAVREAGHPVHLLCGPRGRAAAELLPGVDRLLELRTPWIDPDPVPVRREDADRLVDQVRELGVAQALVLGSSHQSPLPLALLLRWAGVERIAAVSHEYAGSLLDVRIPGDPEQHEVERNLAVAAALGFPRPADDRLALAPVHGRDGGDDRAGRGARSAGSGRRGEALDRAEERFCEGQPYVVVHPGATVPARTLSAARWADVTKALVDAGRTVVLTGSGEERRLTRRIAGNHPCVWDLGGSTTFRGLADVIAGAVAFVSGNTGPMHLAAAVGIPTVAVFPPTVPLQRWRPWRVRHIALGDQSVPCAGCRARRCPLPRQLCLAGVDPRDVVEAVEALVGPAHVTAASASAPADRRVFA